MTDISRLETAARLGIFAERFDRHVWAEVCKLIGRGYDPESIARNLGLERETIAALHRKFSH
jgi:hypothetical protein